MKFWGKGALLVFGLFFLLALSGPAMGAKTAKPEAEEPQVEIKPPPQEKPVEPPGYFPGLIAPSTIGTIEEGPVSGMLSPYGNSTTYDNLARGWHSRKIGKTTVTPYLELGGLYRSNIYNTPSDKRSDFITTIVPGIRAEIPVARRSVLSLGYLGGAFIYSTYTNQSHYDQNINADLSLNPQSRLSFRMGDTLRLATEERNSEFSTNREYLRNTPYVVATYKFADRWKVEGNYQLDTLHFARSVDRFNNYNQHTAASTLYYRFAPKTALLGEYIFVYRGYPSFSQDNTISSSPLVGLTWDPTSKLSGTVKVGWTFSSYETSLPDRNNNPTGWTLSAQLLYRFSRYTNLAVTGQRSFQQDPDFLNAAYYNNAVWVTLNHEFHKWRVASYASFFFTSNAYINPAVDAVGQIDTRNDSLVGFGAGLSRPINRWLRVRVAYSYVNRSSNFPGYSYNDNRVLGALQTSF
jgi:hypothetical protein